MADPAPPVRLRNLGLVVGGGATGPSNTIVDVPGVRVGHTTLTDGETRFTGATALAFDGAGPQHPLPAALHVGNGYGKFVGATQIGELGEIETPVILTSTLSTFRAADALVTWTLDNHGPDLFSINPVVGEINDGWLSDARSRPLHEDHFLAAIGTASTTPVVLGNIGGGTGACALGFKSGIGSASRRLEYRSGAATLGVLVQANMDGDLRILGQTVRPADFGFAPASPVDARGSCVIIVATDARLSATVLKRVAARAVIALARVGARFSHGSGDYALAVSTSHSEQARTLEASELTYTFETVMDAVEEAVIDGLLAAETVTTAAGRIAHRLPHRVLHGLA